jgi:hypothetical protein
MQTNLSVTLPCDQWTMISSALARVIMKLTAPEQQATLTLLTEIGQECREARVMLDASAAGAAWMTSK